jgi:hypothetical protein
MRLLFIPGLEGNMVDWMAHKGESSLPAKPHFAVSLWMARALHDMSATDAMHEPYPNAVLRRDVY